MNETHAQFFRELRELCGKYKMIIDADDSILLFKPYNIDGPKYRSHGFTFGSKTVAVVNNETFDAAKEEGAK